MLNFKDHIEEVRELCKKHNVSKLYVFGSVVRGDFTSESDIDFLVEFDSKLSPEDYSDAYFDLYYALQDQFKRKIDLITNRNLRNPILINSIEANRELLYEAA